MVSSLFSQQNTLVTNPPNSGTTTNESIRKLTLYALSRKVLGRKRLLIASNRGPVTYEQAPDGTLCCNRGSGGVVTALSSLTSYANVTWIAAALSEADRNLAHQTQKVSKNLNLRFVKLESACMENYLNVFSNPLLWFIQHSMLDQLNELSQAKIWRAWQTGYTKANQKFAQALLSEADRPDTAPIVVFHDYQLYLAPKLVREQRPDLTLLHFTHIPWPTPQVWQSSKLPSEMVRAICSSLLSCDIAGFQCEADALAFIQTCQTYLPQAKVCHNNTSDDDNYFTLGYQGRTTQIRIYPISIDPEHVRQTYAQTAQTYREELVKFVGLTDETKLIVRVDRLDPSKNVVAGFEAYERLLEAQPNLHGKVSFLALLVPSRENVDEYAAYKEQTFALIERINQKFGRAGAWQPIHYIYGNDYARALAAMGMADVLLVNSLADGMNLVAKEACVVNENEAVLVLSNQIGAWQELSVGALGVDPTDSQATAQALDTALKMSATERSERAAKLSKVVETRDLTNWLASHLVDLNWVIRERAMQQQKVANK